MSLRRTLNASGIAHSNADSKLHAEHIRQRKQFREVSWVAESSSTENSAEEFALQLGDIPLGKGLYYVGQGNAETPVEGEAFEKHLSAVNWERRWNFAQMKRGVKVCMVKRKRSTPACAECVVNFSPWQMTFLNGELNRWQIAGISAEKRKELLLAILNPLRKSVVEEFDVSTGREILGSYIHLDSNKVHFGVIHSSVNAENKLVGARHLLTIGAWSVAQARITALGVADPADTRLKQNLEKFASRHGEKTVPLDLRLHFKLDSEFQRLICGSGGGDGKRFEASKEHYRQWKTKARREVLTRSPSAQKIAMQVLRHLLPLLPNEIRMAVGISRTAVQAFTVVNTALDKLNTPPQPPTHSQHLDKIL